MIGHNAFEGRPLWEYNNPGSLYIFSRLPLNIASQTATQWILAGCSHEDRALNNICTIAGIQDRWSRYVLDLALITLRFPIFTKMRFCVWHFFFE